MATFCRQTAAVDRHGKEIYTRDILLYESEDEIGYFFVEDEERIIDIVWGEIVTLESLKTEDIKVIGNLIDEPDFIEGMQYYRDNDMEMPYLPLLNIQQSSYPYFRLECSRCGHVLISCKYMAKHKECGGILKAGFTSEICKEKEQMFA